MIPCAYLRVFRPLEAFGEAERVHWERFILNGTGPRPGRPAYRDEVSPAGSHVGLLTPAEAESADVRLVRGRYFVCPSRTRLRVLASLISLRESGPPEVASVFVPEARARRAAREMARLRRREPSAVPTVLQSAWHVPIRWFILVDEGERHLAETPAGHHRLYYWTAVTQARRRAQHALRTLRRSELAPLGPMVREMDEWLSGFDPSSIVELDYADVSRLFSWDELDDDHGGRDIQEAIRLVGRPGGMPEAARLYQQVAGRWAEPLSRESLN